VLGPHQTAAGWVIRVFAPDAISVRALTRDGKLIAELPRRKDDIFEALILSLKERPTYRVEVTTAHGSYSYMDSYAFGPALGPLDDYLVREGTHRQLYRRLGAQLIRHEGVDGVLFALWAPNATRVSIVGDFNRWDGRRCQMRRRFDSGLWEIFVPELTVGAVYKFELLDPNGRCCRSKRTRSASRPSFGPRLLQSSPTALTSPGQTPGTWRSAARANLGGKPMSIYEAHLGSWRRGDGGRFLTYDELADQLIPYVADLGYTHLELLPISEHPLDESWGLPADRPLRTDPALRRSGRLRALCRSSTRRGPRCHPRLEVPAHFPTDQQGLAHFDGTALYEHADPRKGFQPDWNTAIYNVWPHRGRQFSLLQRTLLGRSLPHRRPARRRRRLDALPRLLPQGGRMAAQPGRQQGKSGSDRLSAPGQRGLSTAAFQGAVTIAEESTAFPGVSRPTDQGGLGFGFKWNMGWMHDTLDYVSEDPIYRRWHHNKMTFGLLYAFSENFVLPISHDEGVHGKRSVMAGCRGTNGSASPMRAPSMASCGVHPGKKLLFMGQEFGQTNEWNASESLPWWLLDYWPHQGVQALIRDLNRFYRETPALYARDCEPEGFR